MSYLFVSFLVALLLSLFVASWRAAIWAIAVESFISGLILARGEGLGSWPARIQAFDLFTVRAVIFPLCLIGILRKLKTPAEFETIPANFVAWIFAAVLLIASYWFGQDLFPNDMTNAGYLGTAASAVLIGLFVLSNQTLVHGQIIGLLTFEAGIFLAELVTHHREGWQIQAGLSVLFAWTLVLFLTFLNRLAALQPKQGDSFLPALAEQEEKDVL